MAAERLQFRKEALISAKCERKSAYFLLNFEVKIESQKSLRIFRRFTVSIYYLMRLDETGRLERSSSNPHTGGPPTRNTFYCAWYVTLLWPRSIVFAKVCGRRAHPQVRRLRVCRTNGCVLEASWFGPHRLEFEDNSCSGR